MKLLSLEKKLLTYCAAPVINRKILSLGRFFDEAYIIPGENKQEFFIGFNFRGVNEAGLRSLESLERVDNYLFTKHKDDSTILVFSIPVEWRSDLHLCLQGRYSHCSAAYKEKVLSLSLLHQTLLSRAAVQKTVLYGIFYKANALKAYWENVFGAELSHSNELWSKFNEEKDYLYDI